MEIPVPSLETVKAIWNWVLKNLELWLQVLKDPSSVLIDLDLQSTDATIRAIQFSIFPISLGLIIELPLYLMTKDAVFGWAGYGIAKFVLNFGEVVIFAVVQRAFAKMVFGKGSLNACLITTLYYTAFFPLSCFLNYLVISDPKLISRAKEVGTQVTLTTGDYVKFLSVMSIGVLTVMYLVYKLVPMVRLIHRVGRIRAFLISLGTICVGGAGGVFLEEPLSVLFGN